MANETFVFNGALYLLCQCQGELFGAIHSVSCEYGIDYINTTIRWLDRGIDPEFLTPVIGIRKYQLQFSQRISPIAVVARGLREIAGLEMLNFMEFDFQAVNEWIDNAEKWEKNHIIITPKGFRESGKADVIDLLSNAKEVSRRER
ncbi:hypothetical protein COU60_01600 [Candidatus Pacearchaeota archaeon CG10_big_fil_rev_8_21_14_0_10_34_76]|nr:MAG: hypothetical protein COU60_01600 [Candidatus Pacearchaeota archaeon CG10_big_fil_rev_8_21_14_0_10_34_76]